jgi:hypothetical protein
MGNRAALKSPNEKRTIYFSDVTDNLTVSALTGKLALATNEQDVINSYRRIIEIGKYEREYDNNGIGIRKLLFEQPDPVTAVTLKEMIELACKRETRGKVLSVVVNEYPDNASYIINLTVELINNPDPISFNIVLKRIR